MLLMTPKSKGDAWVKHLRAQDPGLDLRVWPETGPADEIEFILCWKHPLGELKKFRNLKCIASLGFGGETVQRMAVFLDREMGQDDDGLPDFRQIEEHRQGRLDLVAHARDVDDHVRGLLGNQDSCEARDHGLSSACIRSAVCRVCW